MAEKPRYRHTCQVVGKRQMLGLGGLSPRTGDQDNASGLLAQDVEIFDKRRMV